MALGWFRKTKNKRDHEPVEDPVAQVPEDKAPTPESEAQQVMSEKVTASEDQLLGPEQTADADSSDEPVEDNSTDAESSGYFRRLQNRLSKTRRNLSDGFEKVFAGRKKFDQNALEDLEELLITSDIGVQTTMTLMERITHAKVTHISEVKQLLKEEILSILSTPSAKPETETDTPPCDPGSGS